MKKQLLAIKQSLVALVLCGISFTHTASALEEFVIEDIEIAGLSRLDAGTVFSYLPLTIGDTLNDESANFAIQTLNNTGLFDNVTLEKKGNILVIAIKELPSISEVNVEGNKQIKTDDILNAFDQVGLVQGRIFEKSVVDQVAKEIKSQYFALGRYNAEVTTKIVQDSQNRVIVNIDIEEGEVAKITEIKILGNEVFSDDDITDRLLLTTKGITTIFTKRDRYSKQKLGADLETIRSFYFDRGYLDFDIESTQVSITPNKQDVFITIALNEGEQYEFSGFTIEGDSGNVDREKLASFVLLEEGEVFSLKAINEAREFMIYELASDGFAFNDVIATAQKDEALNTVSYIFSLNPGKRAYVRKINISGNETTQDEVIRREMRQLEGATYSGAQIERSKERLIRLGYFETVQVETTAVPGTLDEVNVDVNVEEKSTGNFLLGVGYSSSDGILLRGSITQRNLFGTGKELTFSADESDAVTSYGITYRNPYYTTSGISRGFRLNYREVDASEVDTADYLLDSLSGGVFYSIPLSEFNALNLGADIVNIDLQETDETPPEFLDFINEHPSDTYVRLTSSISHDTRNSILWPEKGGLVELSLEASAPTGDTEYYKSDLSGVYYQPLTDDLVFKVGGSISYGDGYGDTDTLPFYENFFAGGASTVRGYDSRSLGPRDSTPDQDPTGGSQRLLGNVEVLFPFPGASEKKDKRLGIFVDAGQTFASGDGYNFDELRASAGVAFYWASPVGPLRLSWAEPLNDEDGDDLENFQFTIGTAF